MMGAMMTGDPGRRESRAAAARGRVSAAKIRGALMRCCVAAIVVALAAPAAKRAAADAGGVSDEWIMTMVRRHCAMCHSENPSHTMLLGQPPPKGVVLASIDDVRRFAPRIMEMVVRRKLMPFGNETAMADADRVRFGEWLAAR
jgi:uncharacterized membrane protein